MSTWFDRDKLYSRKNPISKENHIGIEIEFLIDRKKYKSLEEQIIKKDLHWNTQLGEDHSIRDLDFVAKFDSMGFTTNIEKSKMGKELRLLTTEKNFIDDINSVCSILNECGAEVNSTCGLHVHMDMRYRDKEIVINNLYRFQNLFYKLQNKTRLLSKYCKKLPSLKTKQKDRYYGINIHAYDRLRTIELRMHEGTIDAKDIKTWVALLIKICNLKEKITRNQKDFSALTLTDKMKEYLLMKLESKKAS